MIKDNLDASFKLGRPGELSGETVYNSTNKTLEDDDLASNGMTYFVEDNGQDRKVIDASSILGTYNYEGLFSPTDVRAYPTMTQGPWVITNPNDRARDTLGFTNKNLHRRLDPKLPEGTYRAELEPRNYDGIHPYRLSSSESSVSDDSCCCCCNTDGDSDHTTLVDEILPREYSVQIQGVHSFRTTRKHEHVDYQELDDIVDNMAATFEYDDNYKEKLKQDALDRMLQMEDKEIP